MLEPLYTPTDEDAAEIAELEKVASGATPPEAEEPEKPEDKPEPDKPEAKPGPSADEEEARRRGWVPKEEWKGAPEAWKPADKWLDYGDSAIRRLQRELLEVKANSARMQAQMVREQHAAIEKAIRDTEARIAQADAEGNITEALKAERERTELQQTASELRRGQQAPEVVPGRDPNLWVRWQAENPWFSDEGRDANSAAAIAYGKAREAEGVPYDAMLREVSERFGPKKAPVAPAPPVESPRAPSRAVPKNKWGDLPQEAKNDFLKAVRYGVFKDNDADRALYAREILGG